MSLIYAVLSISKCWYFTVKKRLGSEGADVDIKAYVKYGNIRGGTKLINGFFFGGRYSQFLLGNEMFLPGEAGRINGMEAEIGDCVQDFVREALFPEWSYFAEWSGNGLNGL
ncbi:hypothetical protein [Gelidibacter gilvus]|uniref:Uncharacterized protein n=1 Tax=Gelidibacter gilvus TaxID=59602 RepID=A0A4Q0XDB2_9FLAO|nr:hypothetical protein [Gelidibacter gilvus]RXJ45717.1 hypothetical protein ESZ48_15085 [Gelidibacter gilvus]